MALLSANKFVIPRKACYDVVGHSRVKYLQTPLRDRDGFARNVHCIRGGLIEDVAERIYSLCASSDPPAAIVAVCIFNKFTLREWRNGRRVYHLSYKSCREACHDIMYKICRMKERAYDINPYVQLVISMDHSGHLGAMEGNKRIYPQDQFLLDHQLTCVNAEIKKENDR